MWRYRLPSTGQWCAGGRLELGERNGRDSSLPPSEGTSPTNTVISDLQLPELWHRKFLYKPPYFWCFVMAALGNEYIGTLLFFRWLNWALVKVKCRTWTKAWVGTETSRAPGSGCLLYRTLRKEDKQEAWRLLPEGEEVAVLRGSNAWGGVGVSAGSSHFCFYVAH